MRKIVSVLAMLFLVSSIAFSQTRTVTGKVSDDVGNAIPFASIAEKGTKNGVSADAEGNFKINIRRNVLVVSATGFASKDVTVSGDVANVSLQTSVASMDEVIVTGVVGATDKKKMTVSVTKVTSEQLNAVPAASLASALTGKVAGVKATSVGGVPGQAMDIQLRADNNLNVGSSPLIIVDGVILAGSLADINADDVESMEVVKGAAASALYGSRAGNGVIAVITKRGKGVGLNQVKITLRNEVGFQNLAHELDVAGHHPYDLATDWETAKGKYTKYKGVTYPANYLGAGFDPDVKGNRPIKTDHYLDNPFGVVRDNQADFFRTGINYTNFAAISTRTEKNNLYTSFENNEQQGIIQSTDGYKRQNFRVNFDQTVTKWLKLSASNLFINRQTQAPGGGGGIFYDIARMEPDVNLNQLNPDGQPYYLRVNHFVGEVINPLYRLWKQKANQKERRWLGNYSGNVKFTDWANLDVSYSVEIRNTRNTTYNPRDTWSGGGDDPYVNKGMVYSGGSLSKGSSEANNQNTQFTLNLAQEFGDLSVRGRLSYLYESAVYEDYSVGASGFGIREIPDFSNFATIDNAGSANTTQRAQNYFAIASLDYKGKYLLDGMYRYDGSSLFGSEARWNPYYRISGAYRLSQDLHINGIDELKIRAAKGTAGIRPGFDWQYEVYSLSNGFASASQKGNKLLKPSKTDETEVGLNVNFLKKFTFEGTYATSTTSDQFINVPLIPFLNDGFNTQWQNAGSVKSNTIELTLGANWIKTGDLKWNTNIVYSRIRQKITSLPIAPYLFGDGNFGDQDMFYVKEGETYGSMYGNKFVMSLGEMSKQLPAGKSIADYELNSDGYVVPKGSQGTPTELAIKALAADGSTWFGKIGDGNSNFNMGITNTLSYKGLTLYFLLDWKQGGDVYNGKEQRLAFNYMSKRMDMSGVPVAQKKAYDYWSAGFYNANDPVSYWVEDGSYLKLREVALGYSFPASLLKVFNGTVKGINAKVIGRNLLTITNYSGYDPEVGSLRQPYDGIYMNPNYRNVAFSLSLDF